MWRIVISSLLLVSGCEPNYVPGDQFAGKLQNLVDTHITFTDVPRVLPDSEATVLSDLDKAKLRIRRTLSDKALRKISTYPVTAVIELDSECVGFLFFDEHRVLKDFHIQASS